jgi:hypothetical protein
MMEAEPVKGYMSQMTYAGRAAPGETASRLPWFERLIVHHDLPEGRGKFLLLGSGIEGREPCFNIGDIQIGILQDHGPDIFQ